MSIATSPPDKSLNLPAELLTDIFGELDNKCNATNMRVCREWALVTRPVLWKNVDTFPHFKAFLDILGDWPWKKNAEQLPGVLNWARFLEYANMVQSLTAISSDSIVLRILQFMSMTRPVFELTPKLQSLICVIEYEDDSLALPALLSNFCHSNLNRLVIDFKVSVWNILPSSIPVVRMTNLRSLEIKAYDAAEVRTIMDLSELIAALRPLVHLRTLTLPRYTVDAHIFTALSVLPSLREITSNNTGPSSGFRSRVTEFTISNNPDDLLSLTPGAFPSLRKLTLSGTTRSMHSLVENRFFPTEIESLVIEAVGASQEYLYQGFSETLHRTCKSLRQLTIRDMRPALYHRNQGFDLKPGLTWNLTELRLTFFDTLRTSDENILNIASSMPHMVHLYLNPMPMEVNHQYFPSITSALGGFSMHCPKLKQLGIPFETRGIGTVDMANLVPFPALEVLEVGASRLHISDVNGVSTLLAEMLPNTTHFLHMSSHRAWGMVAAKLQLLKQTKRDKAPKRQNSNHTVVFAFLDKQDRAVLAMMFDYRASYSFSRGKDRLELSTAKWETEPNLHLSSLLRPVLEMSNLPSELVRKILRTCIFDPEVYSNPYDLALVCSQWNAIILTDKTVWNDLHITWSKGNGGGADPCYLIQPCQRTLPFRTRPHDVPSAAGFISLVRRVKMLDLSPSVFPALRVLKMHARAGLELQYHGESKFVINTPFERLTQIFMEHSTQRAAAVREILRSGPNPSILEELSFILCESSDDDDSVIPQVEIDLPRLRMLKIRCVDPAQVPRCLELFFRHLSLPVIRDLSLDAQLITDEHALAPLLLEIFEPHSSLENLTLLADIPLPELRSMLSSLSTLSTLTLSAPIRDNGNIYMRCRYEEVFDFLINSEDNEILLPNLAYISIEDTVPSSIPEDLYLPSGMPNPLTIRQLAIERLQLFVERRCVRRMVGTEHLRHASITWRNLTREWGDNVKVTNVDAGRSCMYNVPIVKSRPDKSEVEFLVRGWIHP
ncbi:hypothetical protein H0H93_005137 [Arthromyces matolae]|nr:hypothetical protein H0H93_005137 [Arthromyces matolae]